MVFSFVERIGAARGFSNHIQIVLISSAVINLFAAAIAAVLKRKMAALKVAFFGATLQAALTVTIVFGTAFASYVVGAVFFVSAMIICHTFVFGWLSLNDDSGRAVALAPAMLMSGAAIGPFMGGVLFADLGEWSLTVAAVILDAMPLVGICAHGGCRGVPRVQQAWATAQ